jgi:hypothetical protein
MIIPLHVFHYHFYLSIVCQYLLFIVFNLCGITFEVLLPLIMIKKNSIVKCFETQILKNKNKNG